jgi:hypothetical protein
MTPLSLDAKPKVIAEMQCETLHESIFYAIQDCKVENELNIWIARIKRNSSEFTPEELNELIRQVAAKQLSFENDWSRN